MPDPTHRSLLSALAKVDRPATFCARGRMAPVFPGLEVAGVGPVALPLGKRQAASLRKKARPAPYGKGTETLVDAAVRKCWEIDAEAVRLANPEWSAALTQVVRAVEAELGLEKQSLAASLYKLLLYETGGFFLPHRDGEKVDRMVATLVVALPSEHTGGTLVVRHDGREEVVDFGPDSVFHTQYAAFYADCEHEVRPVASGCRLALVYNLSLAKGADGGKAKAPSNRANVAALAKILTKWRLDDASFGDDPARMPAKMAVVLDHKYTAAGLAYDALKGADRAKAEALFNAAAEAGCNAYLALATHWLSGAAEPSFEGWSRRRRGYDEDAAEEHELGEIYDEAMTLEHFSDAQGRPLGVRSLPLEEGEVVSKKPLDDGAPDREEFEGYTGNAGMTLQRWYHRAAVVLWPSAAHFNVLCEAGLHSASAALDVMVQEWKRTKSASKEADRRRCLDFADRIIARWPACEHARSRRHDDDAPQPLLRALASLADAGRIGAWIRGVLARDASVDPQEWLGDVCEQLGWSTFQDDLQSLFRAASNETLEREMRLLTDWSLRKGGGVERKGLCRRLAGLLMDAVEQRPLAPPQGAWRGRRVDAKALLHQMLQAFAALEATDLLERLRVFVRDRPKEFDPTAVQAPAFLELGPWILKNVERPCPPLRDWWTALRDELAARVAQTPQEPNGWRRPSDVPCKCFECETLSRFLDDPQRQTLRIPLPQIRRAHLHQIVDDNRLDTSHVTERKGRPFTLVFTKTNATYERAVAAHRVELDLLQGILTLLERHAEPTPKRRTRGA